ncbi:MAG TPA: M14 family zinc carboxypeptidase [Candidatus Limnocylindrales bacterium]|nr:M14 family zinc carboxypeptidase [Candidatus Limnocylindrales bacterium]
MRRPTLRGRSMAVALAAASLVAPAAAPSTAAAASDYPSGYRGFHTHAEMTAAVERIAAAHPGIVEVFSIGESWQGRALLAAKVSDNVDADEPEPEAYVDGLTHGNEPMGLEMTLALFRWLAEGYGSDARITSIVDRTEVWIVFAVNPDGQAYDYGSGVLRNWRKNRQPNAGTTAVGTDLNRNYSYRWGESGSSSSPSSSKYRGAAAFSAPETRAVRDFVRSRVIGGRQQIRVAVSFHEFGRFVMWPYAATTADRPSDMTVQDRDMLVGLARRLAGRNGYTAKQASDMYLASGTTADWLYGTYRMAAFTIELSAVDYPRDTAIATETGRNRDAILYLLERAWCPMAVLGTAVRDARCGAFDDDLEVARGWTRDPDGTDTAVTAAAGAFGRGNPAGTSGGGVVLQPDAVPSGRYAYVTGLPAGSNRRSYDLDGRTTVRSPLVTLPATAGQRLTFRWFLAHGADATAADGVRALVETADGSTTELWRRTGSATLRAGTWSSASVALDPWAGQPIRIRFEAVDADGASLVEAGVDDVRVTRPSG